MREEGDVESLRSDKAPLEKVAMMFKWWEKESCMYNG
jgi:hypothetical protein